MCGIGSDPDAAFFVGLDRCVFVYCMCGEYSIDVKEEGLVRPEPADFFSGFHVL